MNEDDWDAVIVGVAIAIFVTALALAAPDVPIASWR